MATAADHEILDKFHSGEQDEAFRDLIEVHGKTVYNIALFTLNDEVFAEDATQDAFIKIYRHLGKFKGDAKLSTWMYRIVKNVCFDYLKKRRHSPLDELSEHYLMSSDSSPEEELLAGWQHQELRDAVERLPVKQRLAITLYYFQDKSYEEVAAIMGQPLNTIKSHLHRAKSALEKSLVRFEGSLA
ncbi:MAG: sigma-70 family RNA polymerase sigma factor [Fidelibacterota bacterium]|nr:MAG: sigma-70 family RNA polymerase sigma factor [Candidatus Neomarinimicrobiota bacterium]